MHHLFSFGNFIFKDNIKDALYFIYGEIFPALIILIGKWSHRAAKCSKTANAGSDW